MGKILHLLMLCCCVVAAAPAAAQDWISAPYRIDKAGSPPDMAAGSLVLMPFTFDNRHRPGRPLEEFEVHLVRMESNRRDYFRFRPTPPRVAGSHGHFPVLLWLAPGKYKVERLAGYGGIRGLLGGQLNFTLDLQFEIGKPGEVLYVGRSELVNVAKSATDDQGTGFPTPMLDQSLWGFADGTLAVQLVDQAAQDWKIYTELFPKLQAAQPKLQQLTHYLLDRAITSVRGPVDVLAPVPPPTPAPVVATAAEPTLAHAVQAAPTPLPAAEKEATTPQVQAVASPMASAVSTVALARGHARQVPARSGYALLTDADAVPVRPEGRDRYLHYLSLPAPKAFAVYETGQWRFWSDSADAMSNLLDHCAREGSRCWLYAVDSEVVWQPEANKRIWRTDQLQRNP